MSVSFCSPPEFLKLLAHDLRWKLITVLTRSDYRVQELVELVHQPHNLVSYHLRRLRKFQLVTDRRSAVDRRDVYYSLCMDEVQRLYQASGQALHPALGQPPAPAQARRRPAHAPWQILFVSTHGRARAPMAAEILRQAGQGCVEAYSAGLTPRALHPLAREVSATRGLALPYQGTPALSAIETQAFDYVITLCDQARELCPTLPGNPQRMHWSCADPTTLGVDDAGRRLFEQTAVELETRINYLMLLICPQCAENSVEGASPAEAWPAALTGLQPTSARRASRDVLVG